ncbi:Condensation domain protein [Aspergillus sclerotialis]|uniref:Condensation domain protein n=1 Tax=Aspergillus sclerotialis TaxID=2070753 RepID=A0A3A2ZQG3_9EURO|nr:Condensation domain protein [Aspergillus sclerotialis]
MPGLIEDHTNTLSLPSSAKGSPNGDVISGPQVGKDVQGWILNELSRFLHLRASEINTKSTFISLGGDSIAAIAFSNSCRSHGYKLPVPNILSSNSIAEMLKGVKVYTDTLDAGHQISEKNSSTGRSLSNVQSTSSPMTEIQLTLFQGSQTRPGSNIVSFRETCLTEMVPYMKRAWRKVIEAVPIFRTKFEIVDGTGMLTLKDKADFRWHEVHVYDRVAFETELDSLPGDTEVSSSFKVITWNRGRQGRWYSTIIWRVHHALIDGYSAKLVYQKVLNAVQNQPFEPGTSFHILAQGIAQPPEKARNAAKEFWARTYEVHKAANGSLPLPVLATAGESSKGSIASVSFQLPLDHLNVVRQRGVSIAALYHGAWALVLSICLDSDSVVFGGVFSGRSVPLPGIHDAIGPVMNSLPFHVTIDRSMTTTEYLHQIFNGMIELDAMAFSQPQDGFSRNFTSTLAAEFDMPVPPYGNGEKAEFLMTSEMPLNVFFRSDGSIRLCYDTSTYRQIDIERLAELFQAAILTLLPTNCTVETCFQQLVSANQLEVLCHMGNAVLDTTTNMSIKDDLVTLFERTATTNSDLVAVERGDEVFTYRQLDAMAGHISRKITRYIDPGDVVCVHADGSMNWIVAMWGILKAGATYSALDMKLPENIRNANYQTADAKLFLTPAAAQKPIKPAACEKCFSIEELLQLPAEEYWPRRTTPRPSANAYICFTSGSTGKPKGVICTHAGLVAFQKDLEVRLFAQPGTKVSQIMSPAFDGSIHEIFSTLCYGGTLVLGEPGNPLGHLNLVDSALMTPSIARTLDPNEYPRLKNVYLVGEVVPQYVNDTWASVKALYNMYGPTEATCGATIKRLHPGVPVTIGKPNPTTRIYILDRYRRLVPPGVVGEIYLAGVQVSRGYIKRPEENEKHFFVDNVFPRCGEMMYRTGDRAYWNSYGEIEFQGRKDRQIKLRGFRMDLNDLEVRLSRAVPEATAVAITPKDDYLVAMIQPNSIDLTNIKAKAQKFMPAHCVPRLFSSVEKLPMTPIGKVDYRKIADTITPSTNHNIKKAKVATKSIEIAANVWRDVLDLPAETGLDADSVFMNLGGHSVAQLLVASKLKSLLKRDVSLKAVVQALTLGELADIIDNIVDHPPLTNASAKSTPSGSLENGNPSPMEVEWFHKYETKTGSSAFNVSFACELDSRVVDLERLANVWDMVMRRHTVLRSRYVRIPEGIRRQSDHPPPRVMRMREINVRSEINRQFDLEKEAPIRVMVSPKHLVVCISHIVCDLTALQVIMREAGSIYNANSTLPPPTPFEETTVWKRTATTAEISFWKSSLSGMRSLPQRKAYSNGTSQMTKLPLDIYRHMCHFAETKHITLHQLGLAAVALATQSGESEIDIVLGAPYLNRGPEDMETVGLFLEPLPIRVKYREQHPGESSSGFLKAVQAASQSSLSHAIPWHQLLHHLGIKPEYPKHPILEMMVTFHDNRGSAKWLDGVEPLITWTHGAKFGLMIEFSAQTKEACLMRIEYDTDLHSEKSIKMLEARIIEALECIVTEQTFDKTLALVMEADKQTQLKSSNSNLFGMALRKI